MWNYQNLTQEDQNKKHQYARERYRNLSNEKKKGSVNMVVNDKNLLENEKAKLSWEYKKYLNFYCLPQVTSKNRNLLNFYFL